MAGVMAGEACFFIDRTGDHYQLGCAIEVRDDDQEMVEIVHSHVGGILSYRLPRPNCPKGANPSVVWRARDRESLARIVRLLDECPLPGKKQRDYLIWREAFDVAAWKDGEARRARMADLKKALHIVKEYRPNPNNTRVNQAA